MDMDAFERLTVETRRHGSCFDALIGLEEAEGSDNDDERAAAAELQCPFCGEELDGVGLCFHIDDEHPAETRAGVCPICTDRVGMDLVGHITSQHPGFFKGRWRNRQFSSGSHSSTLAILKKEARNLQSHYGGSSRVASLNTLPDPLLSSFVGNFVEVDLPKDAQQEFLDESSEKSDSLEQKAAESADEPLLPEVKEERTRRSQFVQGLVLSQIFDDIF